MKASEIRSKFIEFFEGKGHQIVPSAPLVVKNDPTLMFTNAGMNQFKDYFLGNKTPDNQRVADTQKCLRVSGKHNDLEEVGMDTYHHTMFEMLGNWSFGDYFKKEAIEWAWELLTEVYKLPKDRLYATVFRGDEGDGLEFDSESYMFWTNYLSEERILKESKKDNFWEMGDTGPCGPSSEIHIDLRSEEEISKVPGRDLVNKDHPQVVEIWNLVFIEFNRLASGDLSALPQKHVDTGMGFERLVMAIQEVQSNYDTDVFGGLIAEIEKMSGQKYGQDEKTDIAIRVVADHVRAVAFAIADGELPSNNKAGYVIRRILRRAVRYGYTFLGFSEPFLNQLVDNLSEQFKSVFPELSEQNDFVKKVIHEEEVSFLRTLENGLKRLEGVKIGSDKMIDGKTVFELYDTYGFPVDLTALVAREKGLEIDEKGFEAEMKIQKERSKSAAGREAGDWTLVSESEGSEFVGYELLETESKITKYRTVKEKKGTQYQLVLDKTPFYAESGGQVGDTGILKIGEETIPVLDTQKENDLIIHVIKELPSEFASTVTAMVDEKKRILTQNNHSATHLMHAALKQVLGDHVQQRGSLVNDKALRFDFSHFSKMSEEEIRKVEEIVNTRIRENISRGEQREVPIEEAKNMGATALFGEKYGEFVRVITFNPEYSIELCGGTHVDSTGTIGLFKITSESSIAAGTRRVEAVTANEAEHYVFERLDHLHKVEDLLNHPADIEKSVEDLITEKAALQKELEKLQMGQVSSIKDDLIKGSFKSNGATMIIEKVDLPNSDALKKISFDLKREVDGLFMVLAVDFDGKPQLSMVIDDLWVKEKNLHAGNLLRDLARNIQGGGGGQPFFATAGGKNSAGIPDALEAARKLFEETFAVKIQ